MRDWDDSPTFTEYLRRALYDAGWHKGKPLTFYIRMKNNKRKKVRGHFQRLSHVPNPISIWGRLHHHKDVQDQPQGFFIELSHIHWLGHYWGPISFGFPCRQIEWDRFAEQAFAKAWEMARQRMPRLEANTPL